MSLIARRLLAVHPSNPTDDVVQAFTGVPLSLTGQSVTPSSAERIAAVFRAVRLIAQTVASLPLHTYRRLPGGGKERAIDTPLYRLLRNQPNPWQTAFDFWDMEIGHAVLRGNAYAQKVYRGDGELAMLIPLHPDRVTPLLVNGSLIYRWQPNRGSARDFAPDELFRIIANSDDGITGRSPVAVVREAPGIALAAEGFGAKFYGNSAQPSGILTHPQRLSPEAKKKLRAAWTESHQGQDQAYRVAVLEEGLTWTAVGLKMDEAQFMETRKFQVTEIARMFGVPPHLLADLDRATFSNIEQQGLEYLTYCLQAWLERVQQAIWRDCIADYEQDELFCEFLVDALLRTDTTARNLAFAQGRQWGWLCVDDIRDMLNMNPLPDGQGQVFLTPSNMLPADQLNPSPSQDRLPAPPTGAARPALEALFREPLHRAARRETQCVRDALKKKTPDLAKALQGHGEQLARAIGPVMVPAAQLAAAAEGRTIDPTTLGLLQLLATQWAERAAIAATEGWLDWQGNGATGLDAQTDAREVGWPVQAAGALVDLVEANLRAAVGRAA